MHLGVDNTRGEISAGDGSPIVSHCIITDSMRLLPYAESTPSATLCSVVTASKRR